MKKILFSAIAIAAMAVSCQVEKLDEGAAPSGQTVRITAELPDTKTVFNPEDKTVVWEDEDNLTVIVNSTDAYEFLKVSGENAFTASNVTLGDGTNTYHVLYPYNSNVKQVDAEGFTCREDGAKAYVDVPSEAATKQNGINSTSHIKGVMYGYATADGSASPSVQMHQLTALLKIDVTNNHTEPIEVRSISVSTDAANQLLSGTFYINLENGTTESSGPSYTFNSTSLEVSGATLEAGATGTFWVSAHPFSVPQGSHLTVNVDTDKGYVIDERIYEKDLNFAAGTVNTSTFDFKNPVVELEKLTVAEFKAKAVGDVYYELTGIVTDLYNTTYGNFTLVDETGSVSVYGLTATKQATNDKTFGSLGIKEGDIVTLASKRGEFNGEVQAGGSSYPAYYISHVATPYCNVTPSTMSVTAEAGTTTFNVSSNEYWMVSSDNPAYTVSPEEGTGDATITVTYPANEGAEPVEVVFTVLSNSGVEKTVTLTQRTASAEESALAVLVTSASEIVAGKYIILGEFSEGVYALPNAAATSSAPVEVEISTTGIVESNGILTAINNDYVWQFTASGNGFTINPVDDSTIGLGCTNDNDGLRNSSSYADVAWSFATSAKTGWEISSYDTKNNQRWICGYKPTNWRTYKSATTNANCTFRIYKLSE